MTTTLSAIMDKLPIEAQEWIKRMDSQDRHCTKIILKNVGEESFIKYWQSYRDEHKRIQNF